MKFDLEMLITWIKECKKHDIAFFIFFILFILQGIYLLFNPLKIVGFTTITFGLTGILWALLFILRVYLFIMKKDK